MESADFTEEKALAPLGNQQRGVGKPLLERILQGYVTFLQRFKYFIIAFWILSMVGTAYFALKFPGKTTLNFSAPAGTTAAAANSLFQQYFPRESDVSAEIHVILITRKINTTSATINEQEYRNANGESDSAESDGSEDIFPDDGTVINEFTRQICDDIHAKLTSDFKYHSKVQGVITYYDVYDVAEMKQFANLMISRDKGTMLVFAAHAYGIDNDFVHYVYKMLDGFDTRNGEYEYYCTGMDAMLVDVIDGATRDLKRMDLTSLPLALVVLGLVLMSLSLVWLPFINIIIAMVISFGLMYPFTLCFDVASYNPPVMMSLIMAMSIDYALFLLSRFKEELNKGATVRKAVEEMLRHSGKIVLSSGIILLLCFASMLFFSLSFIYTVGISAALALGMTICLALSMTPALIFTFPGFFTKSIPCKKSKGYVRVDSVNNDACEQPAHECVENEHHIDPTSGKKDGIVHPVGALAAPISENAVPSSRHSTHPSHDTGIIGIADDEDQSQQAGEKREHESVNPAEQKRSYLFFKMIACYMQRWWVSLLLIAVCIGVFVPVIYCAKDLKISMDNTMVEPSSGNSVEGLKQVQRNFSPGLISLYKVVMSPKNEANYNTKAGFESAAAFIKGLSSVNGTDPTKVISPSSLAGISISYRESQLLRKHVKAYDLLCKMLISQDGRAGYMIYPTQFDPTVNVSDYVSALRNYTTASTESDKNFVFSPISLFCDLYDGVKSVRSSFPLIIIITFVIVLVITASVFRFASVPVWAVLCVFITLAFAFGSATIGYVYKDFNFLLRGRGALYWFTPIIVFVITVGLSLDYDIFLFSRIAESRRSGWNSRSAIVRGYSSNIGVVLSAGTVMIVAFVGLIPSSVETIEQVGFTLIAAIFLETFIVCMVFVPAIISILKGANWWPYKAKLHKVDPVFSEQQPLLSSEGKSNMEETEK